MVVDDLWRHQTSGPASNTFGTLGVPVYVEADIVPSGILLETDRERIFPVTNLRTDANFFGTSSATLKAKLMNPAVGNYTIRIRLDEFDAEMEAGHSHGAPPSVYWGELENPNPVEDQIEVSCPVEVTEGETSESCEVKFQADEISGKAKFVATVDELTGVEDDAEVEVGFFNLVDAFPILGRPNERRRNPDTRHVDEKAFYVKSLDALQRFKVKYEELTTPATPTPPPPTPATGRYMNFNDFSLPRGGKFDIDGQWSSSTQRHAFHRDGEGIDVNNDTDTDIATGTQVQIQRKTFNRACVGVGGTVIDEGPLHCELGSRP